MVEHVGRRVVDGATDRDIACVAAAFVVIRHVDGGLGRTVEIVHRRGGELADRTNRRGCERLTAGEDAPQRRQGIRCRRVVEGECVGECRQHRRHEMHCRDGLFGDHVAQVPRIAMTVGSRDDECGTRDERQEELPHRDIEGRRCLLQHPIIRGELIAIPHPLQAVHDGAMVDHDALGPARRPGGEQHVGGVVGARCAGLPCGR